MNLELGQLYMKTLIRRALETQVPATGTAPPSSGVHVKQVSLAEKSDANGTLNLVQTTLQPWILGSSNNQADVPRFFDLTLKIVPYLVTRARVADANLRHQLLNGADEGVILRFDAYQVYDRSFSHPVGCHEKDYDVIAYQVLKGIYDGLAKQKALVVPADSVTNLVASLTGGSSKITGVNIGSDLDLKLGFLLDSGTPIPFTPQTSLAHFPGDDWGLQVDTAFITSAVTRAASAKIAEDPNATADSVAVVFRQGGLDLTINGTKRNVGPCSKVNFVARTSITMQIRRDPGGHSVLQAIASEPDVKVDTLGLVCGLIDLLEFGRATLVLGTGSPPAGCKDTLGPPIEFSPGAGDLFFATAIDTDGVFYIAGRSSLMEQQLGPRPAVPAC